MGSNGTCIARSRRITLRLFDLPDFIIGGASLMLLTLVSFSFFCHASFRCNAIKKKLFTGFNG
jgi:hypothetical protein